MTARFLVMGLSGVATVLAFGAATRLVLAADLGLAVHARLAEHRWLATSTTPFFRGGRGIVWLGDSTLADTSRSYAHSMAPMLFDRYRLHTRVVAQRGFDAFHYYCALGPVLAMRPVVVVFIANALMLGPRQLAEGRPLSPMCRSLPSSWIPEALELPFARHGTSRLALLLMQLGRREAAALVVAEVDALRHTLLERFREPWRRLLAARKGQEGVKATSPTAAFDLEPWVRDYGVAIDETNPFLTMLEASVRRVRQTGAQAIVVASPVPWEVLRDRGWWSPEIDGARTRLLRAVAEGNGARFVDFHKTLRSHQFMDPIGHVQPTAVPVLAARMVPRLLEALAEAHAGSSPNVDPPVASTP